MRRVSTSAAALNIIRRWIRRPAIPPPSYIRRRVFGRVSPRPRGFRAGFYRGTGVEGGGFAG